MQGALWGEVIRSPDQMFYMAFPRFYALAERAWHKAPWEDQEPGESKKRNMLSDWSKFANRVGQRELLQLDKLGVTYRIPLPGARYHANFPFFLHFLFCTFYQFSYFYSIIFFFIGGAELVEETLKITKYFGF